MDFWDEIEQQLVRLEELDERYASKIKENESDPLDDEKLVTEILKNRNNYEFIQRSNMLKKRVSFFGIFNAGEDIEMIYS